MITTINIRNGITKELITLVLLMFFCTNSFSQKAKEVRTYVVEYDFETGLFPNGKKIRPRVDVPIVFKIKNINRLAYTISVKSKDSVIGFTDLSGLEKLIDKKEVEKIEADLKKAQTPITLQSNTLSVNAEDFKYIKTPIFKALVNDINNANVTLLEDLNAKLNEVSKSFKNKEIALDKTALKASLSDNFRSHFQYQTDLANLYLKIVVKRESLISFGNDYLKIKEMIKNPILKT